MPTDVGMITESKHRGKSGVLGRRQDHGSIDKATELGRMSGMEALAEPQSILANPPLSDNPNSVAHRITKENAREFSRKAWEARRKRQSDEKAMADKGRNATPESEELAVELRRLRVLISETDDPDDLQKLTAARSRLFSEWQVLTGTPNPGARKTQRRSGAGSQPDFVPQPLPSNT